MTDKKPLTPFVAKIEPNVVEKLKQGLIEQGFEFSTPPYTIFAAKKKNLSVTLYTSLKLTVMGKEMATFMEYFLEPEILGAFPFTHPVASKELDLTGRIGVDEAGKGDFFGPLCIASVFAEGIDIEKLVTMGIRDSKALSDATVIKLANELKKTVQHEVIRIGPAKYNEMYVKFGNLNSLLAWGHATAIEKLHLRTNCKAIVIDKFAHEHVVANAVKRKGLEVALTQKVRAEEDVVVAAASIMARAAFLEGMQKLSEEIGMELPKGASDKVVDAGKRAARQFGKDVLQKIAKLHFRTTEVILSCLDAS